ncbi:DUF6197 family protein [Streptomyces sp. NPDC048179]|uniref:DUF6197 family protein n=1 Tax=Streptomyces sp. NPDC048179 TaxID=3365506 RepID=UPI00371B2A1C
MQYSADSTILPTNARDLLEWAAAHVDARGFHDGRDGRRFGSNGTTTRHLTPGMLGALDVAGGDGRQASARTYDYDALHAAQRLALDTVADLASGGAVVHDDDWADEYRYRRATVHLWGMEDGRTGAEVAALFREAAGHVERAAAAATRPGRPPLRLPVPTVDGVLAWAALHIEDTGHRPDLATHAPAGYADSAACTMLHALDRALVAAKPYPNSSRDWWAAYGEAGPEALRLIADHVAGRPVVDNGDAWETKKRRRSFVLDWGNQPGRSTADVAAAFRAAAQVAIVDDALAGALEVPAEPGQAAFF